MRRSADSVDVGPRGAECEAVKRNDRGYGQVKVTRDRAGGRVTREELSRSTQIGHSVFTTELRETGKNTRSERQEQARDGTCGGATADCVLEGDSDRPYQPDVRQDDISALETDHDCPERSNVCVCDNVPIDRGVELSRLTWTGEVSEDLHVRETEDGCLNVSLINVDGAVASFKVKLVCATGMCDCVHLLGGMCCQLKPCRFFVEVFLRGEWDVDYIYILRGIVFGFRVINDDFKGRYDIGKVGRMNEWERGIIEEKLLAELGAGIVTRVDTPPDCVHGIFVVPKDGGGGRSVVDCSRPEGASVNSATDSIVSHFKYRGVDDVIESLASTDYLASIDIKDAYRAVHIDPRDRCRQGLKWAFKGDDVATYMVDNRLCMGLSSSPYIFSRVSDFVVRCAAREGIRDVVNYLDDFCITGKDEGSAGEYQLKLIAILRRLGFFVSYKKVVSPTTRIRFLGIIIDAPSLELSLPMDKLRKLRTILESFEGRRKANKKELERLGGLLAHCAKVIKGGRTFSRRIYELMGSLKKPYHRVRLNKGVQEDISWWKEFAARFNGKACILGRSVQTMSVYSDASGWGLAAIHGEDWIVGCFKGKDRQALGEYVGHHETGTDINSGEHINIKEMGAVYEGAVRWAPRWKNAAVIFITDSAVVCAALNTGRSRSTRIMGYVRRLFWLAVEHNFTFNSTYINTKVNVVCDALSRLDSKSSNGRIRMVDVSKAMCCASIFEQPPLCLSRTEPTESRAAVV